MTLGSNAGDYDPTMPIPAAGGLRKRILSLEEAVNRREEWRRKGLRVVLTNGCFDLIHVGHARYLGAARALGDRLVVALNDDASVEVRKGVGRPIIVEAERAELLASLRMVDAVTIFADRTAEGVVAAIRPDIYTKGGDYGGCAGEPPEALVAAALGAEIRYLEFVEGRSTRQLIERIRAGRL